MQLLQIILLLILLGDYYVFSLHGKLHEYMTKEEIRSVFFDDHRNIDEIEYEVVPIFHNKAGHQRGKRMVQMNAFNNSYILTLENEDHVLLGSNTKIYTPIVLEGRVVSYKSKPFPYLDKTETYHDVKNRAALVFHTDDDNEVHVHGTIGDNIVLRPLPPRVHNDIINKDPSNYAAAHEPLTGFSSDQTSHHVVIRKDSIGLTNWSKIVDLNLNSVDPSTDLYAQLTIQQIKITRVNNKISAVNKFLLNKLNPTESNKVVEKISTLNAQIDQRNHDSSWSPESISKNISELDNLIESATLKSRVKPPAIELPLKSTEISYLELLIHTDYYTYFAHGENELLVAIYMTAFWNSVDLKFRDLEDPKIRLNIAGLVIEKNEGDEPYMKFHYSKECGNSNAPSVDGLFVDVTKMLHQTDEHFLTHFGHSYDLIVGITNRNLCLHRSSGSSQVLGVSALCAACQHHYREFITEENKEYAISAAILVKDRGGFDGIIVAAHELGHALGSPHDNEEGYQYSRYESLREHVKIGGKCAWEAGHLMSYKANSTNSFHFSYCSKELIRKFVKSPMAECLKNKPNVGRPYPKILPGILQNREQQCQNFVQKPAYTIKDIPKQQELLVGNERVYVNDCTVLYCLGHETYYNNSNNEFVVYNVPIPASTGRQPPADGSSCGFKKICLDGICIDDSRY